MSLSKVQALIASVVALVAAQLGFSRLVDTLFPLVGYGGLLLLGALAYYFLRENLPIMLPNFFLKRLLPAWVRKVLPVKKKTKSRPGGISPSISLISISPFE